MAHSMLKNMRQMAVQATAWLTTPHTHAMGSSHAGASFGGGSGCS